MCCGRMNTEAFNAFEVLMEWLQLQDSINPIQFLHLKISRDMMQGIHKGYDTEKILFTP